MEQKPTFTWFGEEAAPFFAKKISRYSRKTTTSGRNSLRDRNLIQMMEKVRIFSLIGLFAWSSHWFTKNEPKGVFKNHFLQINLKLSNSFPQLLMNESGRIWNKNSDSEFKGLFQKLYN